MSLLFHAIQVLAGRCDYASQLDGVGFNKLDARFGHSLAAIPFNRWTPKMQWAAWKMLCKYRGQLASVGINYDDIPEPKTSPDERDQAEQVLSSQPLSEGLGAAGSGYTVAKVIPVTQPSKRVEIGSQGFEVRFDGPDFQAVLSSVKKIPGRKFVPASKSWIVSFTAESGFALGEMVARHQFLVEENAQAKLHELIESGRERVEVEDKKFLASIALLPPKDFVLPPMNMELMPHQVADIYYNMVLCQGRDILGNTMGAGKTISALGGIEYADAHPELFPEGSYPCLVVVPNLAKLNWPVNVLGDRYRAGLLPHRRIYIINGTAKTIIPESADFVFINYDIVAKHVETLRAHGFKSLILDESHYLKNPTALRTIAIKGRKGNPAKKRKAIIGIKEGIPIVIECSGTMAVNRPVELVPQLDILDRLDEFGGEWKFKQTYCNAHQTRFGWDFSGSSNEHDLNVLLRKTCYRRVTMEQKEVRHIPILVEINNRPEYERAARELIQWYSDKREADKKFQESIAELDETQKKLAIKDRRRAAKGAVEEAEALLRIMALKYIVAVGKLNSVYEWVDNFFEEDPKAKLILFAHARDVQTALIERFKDSPELGVARIVEPDNLVRRKLNEDRFQNDPNCRLIICGVKVASEAITLTAAHHVAHVELGWTPKDHDQADGRAFNRVNDPHGGFSYFFIAANTCDEANARLIDSKRKIIDTITTGGHTEESVTVGDSTVDSSMLFDMLEALKEIHAGED